MNDTSLIDPKVLEWNKQTAKKINEMFKNMDEGEFEKMMSDANSSANLVSSIHMQKVEDNLHHMENKNGHKRYRG